MSWVPRRGRPVALPDDNTPLRGRDVDVRARIAWLLRLSRLAAMRAPAGRFLELLRAEGCHLGPSTLCRYETGAERVPLSVVRAYEAALGLPAGQLVGTVCTIDEVFGPALAEETPPVMSRVEISTALGDWEGLVADNAMRGIDWIRAADVITWPTGPVLPPSVLHAWMDQLVAETTRAVDHELTTRMHALSLFLADRGAIPLLLESIDRVCSDTGAQGVRKVISLLGTSSDRQVLEWLLDHFEKSEGQQMWGAACGLLMPVCRGTLPADLVPRVAHAVLEAAADGGERGRPAFALAQRLSATLTQQVVAQLGRYPAPTAIGARVQSPAALSSYRSAALQVSGLDDGMLDRLLREFLSPDFLERQYYSSLLLAASPYRDVLADVAVQLVREPIEPYADEAAAHGLVYLAGPSQRNALVELLDTCRQHRRFLLRALANGGGVPESVDLAALGEDPQLARAAVYAAGMSDHPDLRWFRTDAAFAGTDIQCSAEWWSRMGPAIGASRPVVRRNVLEMAG